MEVKSIYLDLQKAELNKKGKKSVWKLESEAFKEPLELKIGYDDEDLKLAYREIADIKHEQELLDKKIIRLDGDNVNHNLFREEFQNKINNKQEQINELRLKIENQNKEISQLYKVIADAKTMIETQSGTILHLQDKVKELEKKTSKQPMVFKGTTFLSGHERVGLWILDVPSGEYLLIEKYLLLEANEFVTNMDGLKFNKITVADNQYIPMYNLFWWTPLDTPTAKVFRDLIFIPC